MGIKEKLVEDMKLAMKAKNKTALSTIRMVINAIKNKEKASGDEMSDGEAEAVIAYEVKKRKDSAQAFRGGGRDDLVEIEEAEIKILAKYMPEQMGEDEIRDIARTIIEKVGARSPKDMGQVMRELMPHVKGKADGSTVNAVVKELLTR
ncbi:Transamidase GatB domain protein [hydrothermal vent metagenome]|uniref:Transamidase GatB domain protein n=1 Tax=hydrothermal vent metagenome TaxID=652676 RepID=A0A3B1CFJ4_9ZZZZ